MKPGAQFLCAFVLCVWATASMAHKPSDSYLTLSQPAQGAGLDGQWDIALRDLQHAISLDSNGDGLITWAEAKSRRDAIAGYAFRHLRIEAIARGDRGECPAHARDMLFDEHVDGGYAVLRFDAACSFRPAQLAVHYGLLFELDPNHRGLLDIRSGGVSQALVVGRDNPSVTLNLRSADWGRQFLAFVDEGIWHIWKGYDHILFLLTLLLPAVVIRDHGRWRPRLSFRNAMIDVLKIVTAFTLAHSLTLTLAVNGLVNLPSRWVESGIALTVLLGALNNLYPIVRERRWAVAFAFGLIHGLGFASVLADLGLRSWNLAVALVGFNAGVEVGQFAIVLVFVPLAFGLRETRFYRCAFMPGGAALIGGVAAYWLAIRVSGISLQ